MPLRLPDKLPAIETLSLENIFVLDNGQTRTPEDRQIKIGILNLMPIKETTETDLIRLLSNSPLHIEIDFVKLESHVPKNTSAEHMEAFYKPFSAIKKKRYDGLIVTGAPVELLPFEEVRYWRELTTIFDWARTHVTSTFYICWGAQAALYYFYGVQKHLLDKKLFGIFEHEINDKSFPLFRGFDDAFYAPHSRHTTILAEEVLQHPELTILSQSEEAGVYIVASRGGREFYVTGHSEYAPLTLHNEFTRDMQKGMNNVELPKNYYKDNDPQKGPVVLWRSHANLLFLNWLHEFVFQDTLYEYEKIIQSGNL